MDKDYGVLAVIKMACVHNIFTEMMRIQIFITLLAENDIK